MSWAIVIAISHQPLKLPLPPRIAPHISRLAVQRGLTSCQPPLGLCPCKYPLLSDTVWTFSLHLQNTCSNLCFENLHFFRTRSFVILIIFYFSVVIHYFRLHYMLLIKNNSFKSKLFPFGVNLRVIFTHLSKLTYY